MGLQNREWSIAEYWDGKKLVIAEHKTEVVFMNGLVHGTPGCGGFGGSYYSLSLKQQESGRAILRDPQGTIRIKLKDR